MNTKKFTQVPPVAGNNHHAETDQVEAANQNNTKKGNSKMKDPNALPEETMKYFGVIEGRQRACGKSFHDAQDIASESKLEVVKARDSLKSKEEGGASAPTFFHKVVDRSVGKSLRAAGRNKRKNEVLKLDEFVKIDGGNGPEKLEERVVDTIAAENDGFRKLELAILKTAVHDVAKTLPPECQRVIAVLKKERTPNVPVWVAAKVTEYAYKHKIIPALRKAFAEFRNEI